MFIPDVTASNPYLDFAKANNLDYGDVLNYVGILDGDHKISSYWYSKAYNLSYPIKFAIETLRIKLKEHYFKKK